MTETTIVRRIIWFRLWSRLAFGLAALVVVALLACLSRGFYRPFYQAVALMFWSPYFWWYALSSLTVFGLLAVAIFAEGPYSIVALCLVPIPFAGMVAATVGRWRMALSKLRSSRRP